MTTTATGTVKWFSPRKGFGFIIRDDIPEGGNKEIFIHYSSINMDGFKTLLPGLRVEFEVVDGRKAGSVEAKNVKIIAPKFEEK
jgi:CspA family cold shock protein